MTCPKCKVSMTPYRRPQFTPSDWTTITWTCHICSFEFDEDTTN